MMYCIKRSQMPVNKALGLKGFVMKFQATCHDFSQLFASFLVAL
jgi:hypothetical protein